MNPQTLPHALATGFAWTWHTSAQATVLIALVLVVQWLFRKVLTPRWRYALGLLIVLRLALPFTPPSSFSIFNLRKTFAAPATVPIARTTAPPRFMEPLRPLPPIETPPATLLTWTPPATVAASVPPEKTISLYALAQYVWLAGFAGMLALVAWRHGRFSSELGRWKIVTEPRVLALLTDCQARLGMKRRIRLLAAKRLNTPALFGISRPRLLVPEELLQKLDDRELRHIFLHELVHLRRGDLLVNWVMILLRALHWFNPAVWLALRRLRADQEMACDAAVMSVLAAEERWHYGRTLIRLLDDFSAAGLCPGLVPFITNKQVIKRRITMISQFQPAGRPAMAASVLLLIALGCLTFTRAAEQPAGATKTEPVALPASSTVSVQQIHVASSLAEGLEMMQAQLNEMDKQIRRREEDLAALRNKFDIVDADPHGTKPEIRPDATPSIVNELNSQKALIELDRASAERQLIKLEKLTNFETLRDAIARVAPDPLLQQVMKEWLAARSNLEAQMADKGEGNPDVQKAKRVKEELDRQTQEQVTAIMHALETKVEMLQARAEDIQARLEQARASDVQQANGSREYWDAKLELEKLKQVRQQAAVRLLQEQVEAKLPKMDGVSNEAFDKYQGVVGKLNQLRTQEFEALKIYPENSLEVGAIRKRAIQLQAEKTALEKQYPQLAGLQLPAGRATTPMSSQPANAVLTDGSLYYVNGAQQTMTAKQNPAALEAKLKALDDAIRAKEASLAASSNTSTVPADFSQRWDAAQNESEAVRRMQSSLLDAEAQLLKQETMLGKLRELKSAELIQVLPTTVPDAILAQLLQDYNAADARLAGQRSSLGPNHPDVAATKDLLAKLESQISQRVKGILQGLDMQAQSTRAEINALQSRIAAAQKRAAAVGEYEQYRQTVAELQELRKQRAQLQQELQEPKSAMVRTEENSFSVTGQVKAPGVYPYKGKMTVLEAIDAAGGLTSPTQHKVQVQRANGEIFLLDIIKAQMEPTSNREILPGDQVYVPKRLP